MNNFSKIANYIYSNANLICDVFKRGKYQDVILLLTVLDELTVFWNRRNMMFSKRTTNLKVSWIISTLSCDERMVTRFTTPLNTNERMLEDAPNLASNLRLYINSLSDNMRELIEKHDFDSTIIKLDDIGLLFLVLERFKNVNLHPDNVSNL